VIVRILSKSTLLLIVFAALLPSACQTRPGSQNTANEAAMARLQDNMRSPEDPRGQLLYHLMVAELALKNKQLELAASEYLLAARLGDSGEVAERAMRIALVAKKNDLALRAARRWVELEPDQTSARQSLALLFLRTKQLDKAVDEFDQLIKKADEKQRETVILQISGMLGQEEDLQAATALMRKFKQRYPESTNVDFGIARLALKSGQTDLAQQSIKRALDKRPAEQSYQELHARILMQQGKQADALEVLENVLAQYSESRRLRISYARLLALAGEYDKAVQQFEILLKKQPDDADLLYAAALLAIEVGKLKKGEAYLHRMLSLKTRINDAHYYLGRIAEKRNHFDQAIQWYTQVQTGERGLDAQFRVASLLGRKGDVEAARRFLYELQKHNPEFSIQIYLAEIEILNTAGRYADALTVVSAALETRPKQVDLLYARSLVAEKMGNMKTAEGDLRTLLSVEPENAHALNALGYMLTNHGERYQEALDYIQQALKLLPNEPAVIDSMGWIYYRLGDLTLAEKHLRRAYALNKDAEIASHLAEVLWAQGKKAETRVLLKEAAARDPDSPHLIDVQQRLIR